MEFTSKKNSVKLTDKQTVLKTFTKVDSYYKELSVYKALSGKLNVPKILNDPEGIIEMELVDGQTLLDVLEVSERADTMPVDEFLNLFAWIDSFHKITGLTLKDVNLRNFLIKDGCIYGIDFEEACEGEFIDDFARVIAFIGMYDPPDTEFKKKLTDYLTKKLIELYFEEDELTERIKTEKEAVAFHRMKRAAKQRQG